MLGALLFRRVHPQVLAYRPAQVRHVAIKPENAHACLVHKGVVLPVLRRDPVAPLICVLVRVPMIVVVVVATAAAGAACSTVAAEAVTFGVLWTVGV